LLGPWSVTGTERAYVVPVSKDEYHRFSKVLCKEITLIEGVGMPGEARSGVAVQHLFAVEQDSRQPNLRQVHLLQQGFRPGPTVEVTAGVVGPRTSLRKARPPQVHSGR
jgi:hypothetical protein